MNIIPHDHSTASAHFLSSLLQEMRYPPVWLEQTLLQEGVCPGNYILLYRQCYNLDGTVDEAIMVGVPLS